MPKVSTKDAAALRTATGAGIMDCRRALEETGNDIGRAKTWLRQRGLAGFSASIVGRPSLWSRWRCN